MMDARHQLRRQAAQKIAQGTRLTLTDPLFNLREIVKQMLLLEDHLALASKRCPDCIRKHLLTIEALADEAGCLDCTGLWETTCGNLAERCRQWSERLIDGAEPMSVGQDIRGLRKQLTPMVFDPRGQEAVSRVASVLLHRQAARRRPPPAWQSGTIQTGKTYRHLPEAKAMLHKLQSDPEDDWTYRIVGDPTGKSPWFRIEILDEDGEHVGWM